MAEEEPGYMKDYDFVRVIEGGEFSKIVLCTSESNGGSGSDQEIFFGESDTTTKK